MSPIRLVLADDSLIVREGIVALLTGVQDMEVVAVCGDYEGLRAAVEEHLPDVVLTDIRMPPTQTDEGVRLATELRATHPEVGVVALSQYSDAALVLALLREGSDRRGYLLKDRVHDRGLLTTALRTVADGGSWVDPKVVDVLVDARSREAESPLRDLTPRELEVLAEIANGASNAAIAERLVLTKRAVEKHINAIFLKLGLGAGDDISKRVTAALIFLAEGAADPSGR